MSALTELECSRCGYVWTFGPDELLEDTTGITGPMRPADWLGRMREVGYDAVVCSECGSHESIDAGSGYPFVRLGAGERDLVAVPE